MYTILTVLHVFLAIGLIGLVLMQHGRGADAGAAFGSGASATVFGSRGSGSFLTRATAALATLFFVTSMVLAYFASQVGEPEGLMEGVETPVVPGSVPADAQQEIPAVPMGSPTGAPESDVPAVPQPTPVPVESVPDVPVSPVAQPGAVPAPVPVPAQEAPVAPAEGAPPQNQ